MTPVEIIEQATVDGVILALFTADTITATGDQSAVDRWLPIIRGNKPKVLALLEGERFALFVNNDKTDPVIAAVGIRGVATFELSIPRHSYHEMMLILDTIKSKFT
jgi:hypothetical protein